MVRKVTAKQDECVIVTTGALVTSSVTDNINNSCLSEFGPHIRSNTFEKKRKKTRRSKAASRQHSRSTRVRVYHAPYIIFTRRLVCTMTRDTRKYKSF